MTFGFFAGGGVAKLGFLARVGVALGSAGIGVALGFLAGMGVGMIHSFLAGGGLALFEFVPMLS